MSAKSDVIEYCKRCIHNFLRTISWWVWVEVIFKEVRSWKPSVVICYKAQMQYHVALWRCTASYESYRLTVRVWGDGKICLHAWSSFCKNHFMISFFIGGNSWTSEGQWRKYFSIFYGLFLFVFKCNMFVMMTRASLLLLHHRFSSVFTSNETSEWSARL